MNEPTEPKVCGECGETMDYVEEDPEFGHLGWICTNQECGRV